MRRLRPLAALLFAAAVTVGLTGRGSPPAAAQQSDKQQQLQQQVDESGAAENAARAKVVDAQTQRAKYDAALADVTTRLVAANARLAAAQADVERLAGEQQVLQVKVDATQKKLTAARDDVRHSAVLLYQHGDGTEMIGLLGATDGSGDLVEGKHYLQRVSDKRQGDAKRVTRLEQQLEAQRDAVVQQKQQADAARAAAESEKSQLDALAAQQASARAAADSALQAENAALGDAIAQHDEAEAALAEESARIAAIAQSAGDGPAQGDGTFIWPVSGPISSGFGSRVDPVTGATAYHGGLDIAVPCGTPIKAAGTGTVLTAGWNDGGYGNMTLISHGNGMSTLYGHQSSIIVSAGRVVSQGQVIGYVGSTGKSTGCHLHFEVRVNGNPVDPRGYL
jgi:murein DD-endopeptidase MepM/ murein hydrolase activator NlpD